MGDQINNIRDWALANVLHTQQGANNAHLNKSFGANIEAIPFGSTVTNNTSVTSSGGKLAQAGLVALGLGAGALGLWNLAGPKGIGGTTPPATTPPAVTTPAESSLDPVIIEGVLDWSVGPDGRGRIDGIRAGASVPAGDSEKAGG